MDFIKMGNQTFIDAYLNAIEKHNKKATGASGKFSGTGVLRQAEDDKLDLGDDQGDEEQGDEQEVSLDDDTQETPDEQEEVEGDEEQDEEESFDLGQGEEELQDEPEGEPPQENIEMNFSEALAKEFVQTVNGFTKLCAQIVQKRSVPKDTADKLDKYMRKIKNVISAAEDSV